MIHVANIRRTRDGIYIGRANARYGLPASALANPFKDEQTLEALIVGGDDFAEYATALAAVGISTEDAAQTWRDLIGA